MIPDCAHEPAIIALFKATGASLGVLAAALAWLLNNLLAWIVWQMGQWRRRHEIIKALHAEIESNSESEKNYADPVEADKLIVRLKSDLGPYKPLAPYVAIVDRNVVFEQVASSITALPARIIEKVVNYYNFTRGLTVQLADFRSDAYKSMSRERQESVIRQTYALGAEVAKAASAALDALRAEIQALKIGFALALVGLAITALVLVPAAIGLASRVMNDTVKPAVIWASACDLSPSNLQKHP
jgi:hypothetical protein